MTTLSKLLPTLLLLGLPVGCHAEDAPDDSELVAADAVTTRSTMLASGAHQFRVDVTYGADVEPAEIETLIESMVILPRAEAFPDLTAEQLELLGSVQPEVEPLTADGIHVELQPLDAGVSAADYAWRSSFDATAEAPSAAADPAGATAGSELGTDRQALRADFLLDPGEFHFSGSVTCTAVNFSWLLLLGSGTVSLIDTDSNMRETKNVAVFPPTMGAVTIPFRHRYRVRGTGDIHGTGLALTGALTCL